jgi:hypothetical protein
MTVEPGNASEIARSIETLTNDPALARECGARGRRLAEREYSWAFIVGDWMRQLQLVLRGEDPAVPNSSTPRPGPSSTGALAVGNGL